MKILAAEQIRALDAFTIRYEPIASIDLMERAANAFVNIFTQLKSVNRIALIHIFCGPGNNGGDGLAVARLLFHKAYNVKVYVCRIGSASSDDFNANWNRLPDLLQKRTTEIHKNDLLDLSLHGVIIDGIFGSGLSRPLSGYWADLVNVLNESPTLKVAIDIPSGVFADQSTKGHPAFQAMHTISFQLPKLAFFFTENYQFIGKWNIVPIGLDPFFIKDANTDHIYIEDDFVKTLLKTRGKYDHKGIFGHALLIAGSEGMAGAAVLATKAALRSGAGLVNVHVPQRLYAILQSSCPEAMCSLDEHPTLFSKVPDLIQYNAIGIGPGLKTEDATAAALGSLLEAVSDPIVIDADALNLLALHPELMDLIPPHSILTPHPGEFKRLFGCSANDFERLELQKQMSKKYDVNILLKGAHSCLTAPSGQVYFNSTGNPGMAKGGSGDVLTGLITGLLAQQGYAPKDAAIVGMYAHGKAGDEAAKTVGQSALIASDIIEYLKAIF